MDSLGTLIRQYRVKNAMTQLELAHKLGYETSQFVSLFERGESKIPLETVGQLTVILRIPEDKIKKILVREFAEELAAKIAMGKKSAGKFRIS